MSEIEPGSPCPQPDCGGHMDIGMPEGCSCHISAPCSACENSGYVCDECGFDTAEEWRLNRDIERDEEAKRFTSIRGQRRHETTSTYTDGPFNSTPFTRCCSIAAVNTDRCPHCEAKIIFHYDGLAERRRQVGLQNCLMCGKKRSGNLGDPGVCCC